MDDNHTPETAAVHRLHAEGLANSPYETLPCAINQTLGVVKVLRSRALAAAAHRFDFSICPIRARVVVIEAKLGISDDTHQEPGL